MTLRLERLLLQLAIALGSLVPLLAGAAGMITGPAMVGGAEGPLPPNFDSHLRYLSGLLCAIGIGFVSCIPHVESKGARFQLLGALVMVGGVGRALSLIDIGPPGTAHRLALGMELGTMPLLMLWQWRIARRSQPLEPDRRRPPKSQGAAGSKPGDPSMASDRK